MPTKEHEQVLATLTRLEREVERMREQLKQIIDEVCIDLLHQIEVLRKRTQARMDAP